MTAQRREKIRSLLKGIETGDPSAVEVIDDTKYIQHNPQTHEGRAGLATLFARLSKTSPRVNVVRLFSDGDYVFGHTEYNFSTQRVGFEVFRFEGDFAVEHWDNIQRRRGPNRSGRSMVDGPTEAVEHYQTERNRALVKSFIESIRISGDRLNLDKFVSEQYAEHGADSEDGLAALRYQLDRRDVVYTRLHRVLAEGCFVLAVCEGTMDGKVSAFYDLFRVQNESLVEHWNTTEAVAPPSEWKNQNGKF